MDSMHGVTFWIAVIILGAMAWLVVALSPHLSTMHGITACEGYNNCEVEKIE